MNERFVYFNGKTYLVRNFNGVLVTGTLQGMLGDHVTHVRVNVYPRRRENIVARLIAVASRH